MTVALRLLATLGIMAIVLMGLFMTLRVLGLLPCF